MKALLAAAMLAPGSAWAANGDIGCIEAKLGQTVMQRIGDGVVVAINGGADPATSLDTDREALLAAREACRSANGWSPAAVTAATNYTQASATMRGTEAALRRDGLDPAALSAIFAKLPDVDRRSFIDKPTAVALRVVIGVSGQPPVRMRALVYLAALSGIEIYRQEFARA